MSLSINGIGSSIRDYFNDMIERDKKAYEERMEIWREQDERLKNFPLVVTESDFYYDDPVDYNKLADYEYKQIKKKIEKGETVTDNEKKLYNNLRKQYFKEGFFSGFDCTGYDQGLLILIYKDRNMTQDDAWKMLTQPNYGDHTSTKISNTFDEIN